MTSPAPDVPRAAPIGAEVAQHVLFHFGEGGYRPGAFFEKLIVAIAAADQGNQLRLALGFPDYVTAVQLAQYEGTGIAALRGFAQGPA